MLVRAQSDNVLVALDGHLKLTDFASAKQMLGRIGPRPPPRATLTVVGAPDYMAPEMICAEPACEEVDTWSWGVLTAEILSGRTPFEPNDGSVETLLRNILSEPFEPPPHPHIGADEITFLSVLLRRDPDARLGSRANGGHVAVLAHPWFASQGVSVHSLLTKRAPAPYVPHLSGPAVAAPPRTAELIEMATHHARPPPATLHTGTAEIGAAARFESAFMAQSVLINFAHNSIWWLWADPVELIFLLLTANDSWSGTYLSTLPLELLERIAHEAASGAPAPSSWLARLSECVLAQLLRSALSQQRLGHGH